MKSEIKMRDENIAKAILEQSCEIQNDEIITERAKIIKILYNY